MGRMVTNYFPCSSGIPTPGERAIGVSVSNSMTVTPITSILVTSLYVFVFSSLTFLEDTIPHVKGGWEDPGLKKVMAVTRWPEGMFAFPFFELKTMRRVCNFLCLFTNDVQHP